MTGKILNVGSINIDHVYAVPHFVTPGETLASESLLTGLGGKGANQSVALARAGAEVIHIGQVNQNDIWAIDVLDTSGVNTQHVAKVTTATGHAIIQVDRHAENAILLHGGANQTLTVEQLIEAFDQHPDADYLLMQNECNLLAEALQLAKTHNIKVVLNPAPMTDSIKQLPWHDIDTLIVNQGEAQALTEQDDLPQIIATLKRQAPNVKVVITLGAQGVILIAAGTEIEISAQAVTAVDTTGAGDTFVGFFLAAIANGLTDRAALEQACSAAALAVTRHGAISSIPTLAELD